MNLIIREKYFDEHKRLESAIIKEAKRVFDIIRRSFEDRTLDEMLAQNGVSLDSIYIEHETEQVEISIEESYCGGWASETQYYAIPFSIMFDEHELNEHIEKLKQRKIELEAKKEWENRLAQQKALSYKRELYQKLKKELGEE